MTTKPRSTQGAKRGHPVKKKRTTRVIAGLARTALTDALSAPEEDVQVTRGVRAQFGTLVALTKTGLKAKGKNVFLRTYVVKGLEPVGSVIVSGGKALRRKQPVAASTAVDENKPIAERLRLLGAWPGNRLEGEQVVKVLSSIRAGAEQIIGSGATASKLLANTNFDGTGMTAEELVREGRAGRVLSRLDDLRYGARG